MKYIYELITPSDPITFEAESDSVAFFCALQLGKGKAGCTRKDENGKEVNIESMLILASGEQIDEIVKKYLGDKSKDFCLNNLKAIGECFNSFAYGNVSDRSQYNAAIEAITDPEKLKEFKRVHEETQCTSLSEWVKYAWKLGEFYTKKAQEVSQDKRGNGL